MNAGSFFNKFSHFFNNNFAHWTVLWQSRYKTGSEAAINIFQVTVDCQNWKFIMRIVMQGEH
jgi:hypothetical protein